MAGSETESCAEMMALISSPMNNAPHTYFNVCYCRAEFGSRRELVVHATEAHGAKQLTEQFEASVEAKDHPGEIGARRKRNGPRFCPYRRKGAAPPIVPVRTVIEPYESKLTSSGIQHKTHSESYRTTKSSEESAYWYSAEQGQTETAGHTDVHPSGEHEQAGSPVYACGRSGHSKRSPAPEPVATGHKKRDLRSADRRTPDQGPHIRKSTGHPRNIFPLQTESVGHTDVRPSDELDLAGSDVYQFGTGGHSNSPDPEPVATGNTRGAGIMTKEAVYLSQAFNMDTSATFVSSHEDNCYPSKVQQQTETAVRVDSRHTIPDGTVDTFGTDVHSASPDPEDVGTGSKRWRSADRRGKVPGRRITRNWKGHHRTQYMNPDDYYHYYQHRPLNASPKHNLTNI